MPPICSWCRVDKEEDSHSNPAGKHHGSSATVKALFKHCGKDRILQGRMPGNTTLQCSLPPGQSIACILFASSPSDGGSIWVFFLACLHAWEIAGFQRGGKRGRNLEMWNKLQQSLMLEYLWWPLCFQLGMGAVISLQGLWCAEALYPQGSFKVGASSPTSPWKLDCTRRVDPEELENKGDGPSFAAN